MCQQLFIISCPFQEIVLFIVVGDKGDVFSAFYVRTSFRGFFMALFLIWGDRPDGHRPPAGCP
jgi:hypothetical protein